ncbi:hypothetical protein [Kolteria novifilia]|uniref:hypothetical protein n=1 Tax=Kolteria novifilia TaxID=2527975 RepID=UPI003AF39855
MVIVGALVVEKMSRDIFWLERELRRPPRMLESTGESTGLGITAAADLWMGRT